jgi:hypothetical protein
MRMDFPNRFFDDEPQQLLFTPNMVVQTPGQLASLFRDVSQRGSIIALLAEDPSRGIDNLLCSGAHLWRFLLPALAP